MLDNQQITSGGIAQQSGLDIFSSIINYTGEFINWGNSFNYLDKLDSDTDYATVAADPQTDALINSPATVSNQWYRYHSSGSPYISIQAPISRNGFFVFAGKKLGSAISYSGMYQKLSGLTVGKEYEISIQTVINEGSGIIYVKTYSPSGDSFIENSSSSISYPVYSSSIGIQKSTFTAVTGNDIILLYFNATIETSEGSESLGFITDISIKEEQEYLVPIYAQDIFGNDHKVLKLNAGNSISDD